MLPMPITAMQRQPSSRILMGDPAAFGAPSQPAASAPPCPRGQWLASIAGLPRRSFVPISEVVVIVNIEILLFAIATFECDESTPLSLPCYPPDRPIRPLDRRK